MTKKSFLIDSTRCTACRGCQIACKAWHKLPAEATAQEGSYQNPTDLGPDTWRLIRFSEQRDPSGRPVWYFFGDSCRHCLEPSCRDEAEKQVPGAIVKDPTGAVLFTEKTKDLDAESIINSCPYNIPRLDRKTGCLVKCDMCISRIRSGYRPACAKACPNGAIVFGDEKKIWHLARHRFAEAVEKYGRRAVLVNEDEVRVIHLLIDDPDKYWQYAAF